MRKPADSDCCVVWRGVQEQVVAHEFSQVDFVKESSKEQGANWDQVSARGGQGPCRENTCGCGDGTFRECHAQGRAASATVASEATRPQLSQFGVTIVPAVPAGGILHTCCARLRCA